MEQRELLQSIIPGLPHEIALECLLRVPYTFHSGLKSVCQDWKRLFSDRGFYRQRRVAGKGEDFVFLVQALTNPSGSSPADASSEKAGGFATSTGPAVYGLSVYNVNDGSEGSWGRIPAPPSTGVPIFSQCVAVAGKLVVVGGWNPGSLDSVADVHVYDLVGGGGWRRGASMSTARSFFACAAVDGRVYVAGGHDNQKNALRSAEVYDPDTDEWRPLSDMAEERDECHGLAGAAPGTNTGVGGGFWVVSGYNTESQGRFGSSAEFYDPNSGSWTRFDDVWPNSNTSPRTASCNPVGSSKMTEIPSLSGAWYFEAAEGMDGNSQSGVKEFDGKDGRWKVVAPMPEGVRSAPCVTVLDVGPGRSSGRVMMIGSGVSESGSSRHTAYIMEIGSKKWKAVEMPSGYEGFVFSSCAMYL